MPDIYINGKVLHYFGNLAGYIDNGRVTVDVMFHSDELVEWLRIQRHTDIEFREGVFDWLLSLPPEKYGEAESQEDPAVPVHESKLQCRIWQLRPESDLLLRFRDYPDLPEAPNQSNYRIAFDGTAQTHDLDRLYDSLRDAPPPELDGHQVSISDVLELYGMCESRFYYIGRSSFHIVDFATPK